MAWKPDYATVSEARDYLRIGDSADDVALARAISAASRAVDRATNRQFGLVDAPEARYYTPKWDRDRCRWVVEIDDAVVVTGAGFALDDGTSYTWSTSLTASDYDLMPRNAPALGRPYTELVIRQTSSARVLGVQDGLKATVRWGWTSFPTTIVGAVLLQVSRLHARRDSPFGVAGSPDVGSELRLLDRLDPDVADMVRAYARWWGAR